MADFSPKIDTWQRCQNRKWKYSYGDSARSRVPRTFSLSLLTEAVHLVNISVHKFQKYQTRPCDSAPRYLTSHPRSLTAETT